MGKDGIKRCSMFQIVNHHSALSTSTASDFPHLCRKPSAEKKSGVWLLINTYCNQHDDALIIGTNSEREDPRRRRTADRLRHLPFCDDSTS